MHKFKSRNFDKLLDVSLLQEWLKKRVIREDIDLSFMPPTGLVVMLDDKPICLGFMIKCDNGMCINSDLISDVDVEKEIRNEAVQFLREELYAIAREDGFKLVTIFTKIPRLQKRLEGLGYFKIDSNLNQLGRFLWP